MHKALYTFLCCLMWQISASQTHLIVENSNGKQQLVKTGKAVGLITYRRDTLAHICCGNDSNSWLLSSIEDAAFTVTNSTTKEKKRYMISDIKTIIFQKSKYRSNSIGGFTLLAGGAFVMLIAPFSGIEDNGYNFSKAGIVLGTGIVVCGLTLRHWARATPREYVIKGVK